jgi:tRNA (mo5U34)-methyltransferase
MTLSLESRVAHLGPWFHNLRLDDGAEPVQTAPDHPLGDFPANFWQFFKHAVPDDLRGKTVLDIGCNGGFYSFEMKRRGASRVLGVDHDETYLNQARFAREQLGLDVEFAQGDVYDIDKLVLGEQFDYVIFMGVLYHLRHPLLALDLIHEHVAGGLTVVQSMLRGESNTLPLAEDYPFSETEIFNRPGYPKMFFVESLYAGDPTNWWIPNGACLEAMLRSAGFSILDHPEPEVFVCKYQSGPLETQAAYAANGADDRG